MEIEEVVHKIDGIYKVSRFSHSIEWFIDGKHGELPKKLKLSILRDTMNELINNENNSLNEKKEK